MERRQRLKEDEPRRRVSGDEKTRDINDFSRLGNNGLGHFQEPKSLRTVPATQDLGLLATSESSTLKHAYFSASVVEQ